MSMFVRVHNSFGQEYVINVDNMRILPGDIQRLLVMTGVADHDTD